MHIKALFRWKKVNSQAFTLDEVDVVIADNRCNKDHRMSSEVILSVVTHTSIKDRFSKHKTISGRQQTQKY